MNEKQKIGEKIWDLFLMNKSYGEIAKELGVSKSLVSNIINYSYPFPLTKKNEDYDLKGMFEAKKELQIFKQKCYKEVKRLKNEIEKEKNLTKKIKNLSILFAVIYSISLFIALGIL